MKNAILPFDKVIVGESEISGRQLVPGSCSISLGGDDKSVTASDGTLICVRSFRTCSASLRALGDFSALATPRGFAVRVAIMLGGSELAAFNALASVSFDSESRSSSISLSGVPETE